MALEAQLRAELAAEGINFDELLDSGRVMSLARRLEELRRKLSVADADGGGALSADARARLSAALARAERAYGRERRRVMGEGLKRVFVAQAWVFGALGGLLAADGPPAPALHWGLPDVVRALGFWTPWLFAVPALRARKGLAPPEKAALNAAFLAMPLLNLAIPYATKDFLLIWALNVALLAACYAFYYYRDARAGGEAGKRVRGIRIRGLLRYLDWGSWR